MVRYLLEQKVQQSAYANRESMMAMNSSRAHKPSSLQCENTCDARKEHCEHTCTDNCLLSAQVDSAEHAYGEVFAQKAYHDCGPVS